MNELCVSCHYARMRDDVCGIYCTGGFVESNGKCRHYKDCEEEWEETGLTREEIVTALRCCAADKCNECRLNFVYPKGGDCIRRMTTAAADLIENQQREMEALRRADNPSVPFGDTSPYTGEAGADRVVRPYEADTDGVPDGDEICRAALEAFGAEAQITMVFEEMAELQDVLCKFLRGRVDASTSTHIAEEIADVEIMLRQMKMLFDCTGQVDGFRWYKLERLAGRIKEKKHD